MAVLHNEVLLFYAQFRPAAQPVHWGEAAEAVVRPFSTSAIQPAWHLDQWSAKLFQCRPLHPIHLANEMGRAGSDGTELDAPGLQTVLELVGEELLPSVCLGTLDGDRHLFDKLVEEGQSTSPTSWAGSNDLMP